jgi:SAM-dependent methyltransferase
MIDVGSGDGKRGRLISDIFGLTRFTAVDNSDGMIEELRKIEEAEVIYADISDESFRINRKHDLVLFLWNVLGHVPTDKQKIALTNLANIVEANGVIFLDVNNRYNIKHYGFRSVIKNAFKDIIKRDKANGDFPLFLKTDKGEIETVVHIFNPLEIKKLIKSAGLEIQKMVVVDYSNGKIGRNIFSGQLVFKLKKK